MPEAPEVETFARRMAKVMEGKSIQLISLFRQNGKYLTNLFDRPPALRGTTVRLARRGTFYPGAVLKVRRHGKVMIFETTKGLMVCHNAMSGYWDTKDDPWTFDYVEGKRTSDFSDVRVTFQMHDGTEVRFHDARLFGSLTFYPGVHDEKDVESLSKLGPDVIDQWTPDDLISSLRRKENKPVKAVIMDQREVAGLGNIYATEGLFLSGVHPLRKAKDVSNREALDIYFNCKRVVNESLAQNLKYTAFLNVYRKEKCPQCNFLVQKIEVDKRSTYLCSGCQK